MSSEPIGALTPAASPRSSSPALIDSAPSVNDSASSVSEELSGHADQRHTPTQPAPAQRGSTLGNLWHRAQQAPGGRSEDLSPEEMARRNLELQELQVKQGILNNLSQMSQDINGLSNHVSGLFDGINSLGTHVN